MRAVIDSDVLVDHLQGRPEAGAEMGRYQECCISLVSWMEIMAGAAKLASGESVCRLFLESFRLLPVTMEVAEQTVVLRRAHKLKLPDAIIWASAQEENCLLVTRNTKDFPGGDAGIRFPYQV